MSSTVLGTEDPMIILKSKKKKTKLFLLEGRKNKEGQPLWLTFVIPNGWYEFMTNVLLSVQ